MGGRKKRGEGGDILSICLKGIKIEGKNTKKGEVLRRGGSWRGLALLTGWACAKLKEISSKKGEKKGGAEGGKTPKKGKMKKKKKLTKPKPKKVSRVLLGKGGKTRKGELQKKVKATVREKAGKGEKITRVQLTEDGIIKRRAESLFRGYA